MALGVIAVLLIVVTGLASTYIREMKLSRTTYDEVIAYANAEGMFEYAMLKVRNHREWFADSVENIEPDGKILIPVSERSRWLQGSYSIVASAKEYTQLLSSNEHLIIPLFVADESIIPVWIRSKNPLVSWKTKKTQWLRVELWDLSWTIIAMSGSESIGITWNGEIIPQKSGIIRHKTSQCYGKNDGSKIDCSLIQTWDEEIQYFYDESKNIGDFLSETTDAYLMVYNNTPASQSIKIASESEFSLPTLSVQSESRKNDSVQVFRFTEDKSRYYDALKYGVYNAD